MTESNFEIEIKKRAKRRLIGAAVLTTLAVAMLPFLFKPAKPSPQQGIIINIIRPNTNDDTFNIPPIPKPALPSTALPDINPAPSTTVATTTSEKPPEVPTESANAPADRDSAPSILAKVTTPKNEGFVIRSVFYENNASLQEISKSLNHEKIKFRIRKEVAQDGKIKSQVVIGPYADKNGAIGAQKKIGAKIKALKNTTIEPVSNDKNS